MNAVFVFSHFSYLVFVLLYLFGIVANCMCNNVNFVNFVGSFNQHTN